MHLSMRFLMRSSFRPLGKAAALLATTLGLAAMAAAQGEVRLILNGGSPGDAFGAAVAGAGDVDGDGTPDIIAGAHLADTDGIDAGSATVFSGADGAVLYTFNGHADFDEFGFSVNGAGDVNTDGFADVIAGGIHDDTLSASGIARVFSGLNGSLLYQLQGLYPADQFGAAVAGAGDVDGDGVGDLIVGAPFAKLFLFSYGNALIVSGASGTGIYLVWGKTSGSRFGTSVDGAGDLDGDGLAEVIVGSPLDDGNGLDSGSARVFSGASGSNIFTFDGNAAGDQCGSGVAGVGDLNGDGTPDLLFGSPFEDANGLDSGAARIVSGFGGVTLATIPGSAAGDRFGASASGAGDADGDGIADLVLGAPGASGGAGAARVVSGKDWTPLGSFAGATASDGLGTAVGGAGDLNGDGFADVIAGAPSGNGGTGLAEALSVCAGEPYGVSAGGTQTLVLAWAPGPAGNVTAGRLDVSGASPFSPGVLAMSTAQASIPILGVTLLVDPTPGTLVAGAFPFGPAGTVSFPINLRQPALAGTTYFFQILELNAAAPAGVYASNGLMLLFCP